MKTNYYSIFFFLFFLACTLEPQLDEVLKDQDVWKDRDFAMGIINGAYDALPAFYTDEWGDFLDCSTDNAVTNNYASDLLKMATGGVTASKNPLNNWRKCYQQINNMNRFLELEKYIEFSNDSEKNLKLHKRLRGEAFFFRAWYQFELLSRFSGPNATGQLLAFPIVTSSSTDIQKTPKKRDTFDNCVEQIKKDIDSSMVYLPEKQYAGKDDVVLSENQIGRVYQWVSRALRSRLLLYAASPAYTINKTEAEKQQLWEDAAQAAMELIQLSGTTLPTISVSGDIYTNPAHAEIIWRKFQPEDNKPEKENFYPAIWGYGRTNPSQQLIDAFPMRNGYPIDEATTYNPANPYTGRENRFGLAILYNDAAFGTNSKVETFVGGADYESAVNTRATRTGYYLRKFLNPTVNITPGTTASTAKHFYVFFKKAEIWLNFIEAANEAWGPTGDPKGLTKTAQSALGELRRRAGISQPDAYLNTTAALGKENLRKLIQNERRIELCFENHRFFDVRRWLLPIEILNEPVKGVLITRNANTGTFSYSYQDVENRTFKSHMYYLPIPEQEVYASQGIIEQNKSW